MSLREEMTDELWFCITKFNRKELDDDSYVHYESDNLIKIGFIDLQKIIDEQIEERKSEINIVNLSPIDENLGKNKMLFFELEYDRGMIFRVKVCEKNPMTGKITELKIKEYYHDFLDFIVKNVICKYCICSEANSLLQR